MAIYLKHAQFLNAIEGNSLKPGIDGILKLVKDVPGKVILKNAALCVMVKKAFRVAKPA